MSLSADPLYPVRKTLKTGNRKAAQRSLRVLLRRQPSAEAWVLAAQSCGSREEAIYCLRQALALQPQHSLAQKRLIRLENTSPTDVRFRQTSPYTPDVLVSQKRPHATGDKRRRPRRRTVFLSLLALMLPVSILTLNLAGLISGPVTALTELTGGLKPVTEINGTPISEVENAALYVQPSQILPLPNQMADVIEPGYAHDFTFDAETGTESAIYVQFLSVAANRVSRNVIVLRPDGSDATPTCDQDAILEGDNGVTYICAIDVAGTWSVRVLGRDKESVGAYFIGEQSMG